MDFEDFVAFALMLLASAYFSLAAVAGHSFLSSLF